MYNYHVTLGINRSIVFSSDSTTALGVLFSFYVLPMVLIISFIGVVTSLFLQKLDSVRKAIVSALELVVLPLLSAIFFGLPLTLSLIVSVACVATGVYFYSKPVVEERKYIVLSQEEEKQETGMNLTVNVEEMVQSMSSRTTTSTKAST